jgi:hypothetical protein
MVDRTYRDIVRSGKYTYRAFVSTVDDFLEARIRSPKPWVLQSKIVGAVRTGARLEQGDERSGAIVGSAVSWPTLPAQFEPATDLGKDRPATDLGKDRPATDLGKGGWSSSLRRAILVSQFRLLRLFPSPIESALRKYVANLTKIGSRLPVRRLRG